MRRSSPFFFIKSNIVLSKGYYVRNSRSILLLLDKKTIMDRYEIQYPISPFIKIQDEFLFLMLSLSKANICVGHLVYKCR
jgi:hypothetical protein